MNQRDEAGLESRATLGVAFEDLTVTGLGAGVTLSDSFGDVLAAPVKNLVKLLSGKREKAPEKVILKGFT